MIASNQRSSSRAAHEGDPPRFVTTLWQRVKVPLDRPRGSSWGACRGLCLMSAGGTSSAGCRATRQRPPCRLRPTAVRSRRIVIVGAGPAGLTAAIAGTRLGLDVKVVEQAPSFAPVGGGIAIQSNGLRVLEALGLLGDFERAVELADRVVIEEPGGRVRDLRLSQGAFSAEPPRRPLARRFTRAVTSGCDPPRCRPGVWAPLHAGGPRWGGDRS